MSVVTGLTLHTGSDEKQTVDEIQRWIASHNFGPLKEVADNYGGSKHPQICLWGAGYNYFPQNKFIEFFKTLSWNEEERVVLLLNPEEGPVRIIVI